MRRLSGVPSVSPPVLSLTSLNSSPAPPPPPTRAMDLLEAALFHEAEDEILATSSSSSSSDQGWQKVTYPKRQRKVAAAPARQAASGPRSDGSSSHVFASVEQKALERRSALESAAAAAAAAEAAAGSSRSKPAARHVVGSDEDDSSGEEAAMGKGEGGDGEFKKVNQKKPKKPRVTVAEAAAKIDASDLASFLLEVGGSYDSQPDIQLMRFADYFARSFAAVSASQFPWMRMFKESPVAKIIDVPICHISESVYKTSADWIGLWPTDALGTFVMWSLDNILTDLVKQQATLKSSKKAIQQSPTKTQVAIFVALAIALRRKPDVLFNVLPTLREDPRYQGHDKLPVIVWIIGQASQGNLVVGMHAWVHNLLPLICGKSSGNPQVRDLILQLAERILSGPKARTVLLNGAVRKGERLVPPLALEQLMRLTFPTLSVRVKEMALAGFAGAKALKPVSQHLLIASIKATRENIPELSKEAADIFIWCLTQNPECFKQWEKLHVENAEASVVVLQKLSDEWKQYATKFSSHDVLRDSLKNLRAKNKEVLSGDLDAGRKATIKDVDKYCKTILGKVARCSSCKKSGLLVLTLAVAAAAFAMSPSADSLDWKKLCIMFSSPQPF